MKKIFFLFFLLFSLSGAYAQNKGSMFEKVMLSGSSEQAFDLVRNMFGMPSFKEPFLHFKERGIKQLVSFYDHKDKRIEATSLIKFSQTKEFWKNYSEQFTAGKWNYKSLYKTDSLAWQAANYSITLIYAHEMGHYMSYNLVSDFDDDYTCEEMVANQCLAAFANAFNGNKKMDMHKRLFLELVKQTAAMIPDSAKTDFYIPMEKWCIPNPMNSFFDYYEKDEIRFLRLYGYIQFRMMEQTLSNYKGGTIDNFLKTNFLNNYDTYTGKEHFKPMRYKIASTKNYSRINDCRVRLSYIRTGMGNYFYPYILNNFRYYIGNNGEILDSYISEQTFFYNDTLEPGTYARFHLTNELQRPDTNLILENIVYADSVSSRQVSGKSVSADFEIQSVFNNTEGTNYLIIKRNRVYATDADIPDSIDVQYEFRHLFKEGDNYYSRRFNLPDSMYKKDDMENQELMLAGSNSGIPLIITNEMTKEHIQTISIYPVNTDSAWLEPVIWQGGPANKGYFNMLYPTVWFDDVARIIQLAFWNPVTGRIYFIKIKETGTEGYELYNQSLTGKYGPKLKVNALRFAAANKLQVFAETRQPGNNTKPVMQHMFIQW